MAHWRLAKEGRERGVLWGPGALLLGRCKIMGYICVHLVDWGYSSAIKQEGLACPPVVPVEEMHPSMAGWDSLCLGKEMASSDISTPFIPVIRRRGW